MKFKTNKKNSLKESSRTEQRLKDYNSYAEWGDQTLDEDGINNWALDKTACQHNFPKSKLRNEIKSSLGENKLTEDTIADVVDNDVNIKNMENSKEDKGILFSILDKALKRNKQLQRMGDEDRVNVWIEGEAGIGKTSIVKQWAQEAGVNLFTVMASSLDEADVGGALYPSNKDVDNPQAIKLRTAFLDALDRPNSVLFLDELNRARKSVRAPLLKLIGEQSIPDPNSPNGMKHFDNMLFAIVASNPPAIGYDTDVLDMAEMTRMKHVNYSAENSQVLNHLIKVFTKELNELEDEEERVEVEGRLELAKALLSNPEFEFDTAVETAQAQEKGQSTLNPRTLKMVLNGSDGTKDDFLAEWSSFANPSKFNMVKSILKNYVDKKDKANDALKQGTESGVFKKKKSLFQQLDDEYGISSGE